MKDHGMSHIYIGGKKVRKVKLLCATLAASTILSMTALAGTWTHTYDDEYGSNTYDNLWYYIKDNGEYAKTEWVQDEDGTWYWIDDTKNLAIFWGIAPDGSLYDSTGKYIDMTDRKYATEELYNQLQEGMSYDQVVGILGKEHEVTRNERRQVGGQTNDYLQARWYAQDGKSKIRITFKNGLLSVRHGDWEY